MKNQTITNLLTILVLTAFIGVGAAVFIGVATAPPPEVEIAGYATSVKERTKGQKHNARLAVERLNGKIIPAGAEFSFNKTVKSWSADQGYVKAPVSYDGELIKAFGGGVCQTSTTLYNAALLAGFPIIERHPHVFTAKYTPPGQDAAVAYPNIDLRFKNPFPFPVRIQAQMKGDKLDIRLIGKEKPKYTVRMAGEVISRKDPESTTRVVYRPNGTSSKAYLRNPGMTGYRVVLYRHFYREGKEVRREFLSDTTYQSMNRVVAITEHD